MWHGKKNYEIEKSITFHFCGVIASTLDILDTNLILLPYPNLRQQYDQRFFSCNDMCGILQTLTV